MIIKKWTRERIELKEKEEIIKKEGGEEGGGIGGCGGEGGGWWHGGEKRDIIRRIKDWWYIANLSNQHFRNISKIDLFQ